jgi:alkylation response protein AidB-like acyl-CoA dehydrogenase
MTPGSGVEHVLIRSVYLDMHYAFTTEQAELKRGARRFLASCSGSAQVRAAMESPGGHDDAAWKSVCELGWSALVIPEMHGGAGLGWVELVAIAEETGRSLACLPFFSTVCLGASALLVAGNEAQQREHLPRIASGEVRAALAFAEETTVDPVSIATLARDDAEGYVLSGTKRYVVDGATADLLVVTARAPATSGDDGVALFAVDARAPGVRREPVSTLDPTRRLGTVELREVHVGRGARMGSASALRRILDRGAVALAAEALGGAERCLEMATDYAKTRVQFDRPIGSFQAIKHRLADMLVAVETARSAVYWAACVAAPDDVNELSTAAAVAKSYATEAFFRCAAECVQIHGGIGFTWEHDAHLYLKRARGSLSLLGSPARDRERIASMLEAV